MRKTDKSSKIANILGIDWSTTSHIEKLVSGFGAFTGIYVIFIISQNFLPGSTAALLVASMGASAMLIFAIPHGALSQPWNLIVGHFVSALIGITVAKYISPILLAASLAVGFSVLAQYYLRCLHPPGGATALATVIGGTEVTNLGYQFILTPVLFNCFALMLVAILFNILVPWRRYPAGWHIKANANTIETTDNRSRLSIKHEDLVYALTELDSFLDVTEDDLLRIYQLATQRSLTPSIEPGNLQVGKYYCNDHDGPAWAVRLIVDCQQENDNEQIDKEMIIYKTVEGHESRSSGLSTRIVFAHWANSEVTLTNGKWVKVNKD